MKQCHNCHLNCFFTGYWKCSVINDIKRSDIDKLPFTICIKEHEKMMAASPCPKGTKLGETIENVSVYLQH